MEELSRRNRRYHGPRCRKAAFLRRQHEREAIAPVTVPPLDREAVLEEALSEPRLVIHLARAAQTNWRAAAWLLERRYPDRWGRGAEPGSTIPPQTDELARLRELHARLEAER